LPDPRKPVKMVVGINFMVVLARDAQATWQIFNIFVPPGAPMGSPQVIT